MNLPFTSPYLQKSRKEEIEKQIDELNESLNSKEAISLGYIFLSFFLIYF